MIYIYMHTFPHTYIDRQLDQIHCDRNFIHSYRNKPANIVDKIDFLIRQEKWEFNFVISDHHFIIKLPTYMNLEFHFFLGHHFYQNHHFLLYQCALADVISTFARKNILSNNHIFFLAIKTDINFINWTIQNGYLFGFLGYQCWLRAIWNFRRVWIKIPE